MPGAHRNARLRVMMQSSLRGICRKSRGTDRIMKDRGTNSILHQLSEHGPDSTTTFDHEVHRGHKAVHVREVQAIAAAADHVLHTPLSTAFQREAQRPLTPPHGAQSPAGRGEGVQRAAGCNRQVHLPCKSALVTKAVVHGDGSHVKDATGKATRHAKALRSQKLWCTGMDHMRRVHE